MKRSSALVFLCVITSSLFCGGCAKKYYQLNLNEATFDEGYEVTENKPVEFSYRYGILSDFGNDAYASKERSKNIDLVAVKITNNTDQALILGTHIFINKNGAPVNPIPKKFAFEKLRQSTPLFLAYLVFSGINYQKTEVTYINGVQTQSTSNFIPVGLILCPALSLINVAKSDKSNKTFKADLSRYYLDKNVILPGETLNGLIAVRQYGERSLTLSYDEGIIK